MAMFASIPSSKRLPCAARPSTSTSIQQKPLCARQSWSSVDSVTIAASVRTCFEHLRHPRARNFLIRRADDHDIARERLPRIDERLHRRNARGHAALHVVLPRP